MNVFVVVGEGVGGLVDCLGKEGYLEASTNVPRLPVRCQDGTQQAARQLVGNPAWCPSVTGFGALVVPATKS